MQKLTIALAGNPNAGKTTIFNNLTGSNQHVGNYPGVTVEKKVGKLKHQDFELTIIDLPGTYSLTSYSPEEVIARRVLLEDPIDVVINVVDATNSERNLNLTVQLKELGIPVVVALNMMDMAAARGIRFDYQLLSQLLGVRVVPVIGTKNEGTSELIEAVIDTSAQTYAAIDKNIRYPEMVEAQIELISGVMPADLDIFERSVGRLDILRRWMAIKLLENDKEALNALQGHSGAKDVAKLVEMSRRDIHQEFRQDAELVIVDSRYAFVRGACREAYSVSLIDQEFMTEKVDAIILNRVLGLPIFLGIMWFLFQLTFTLGSPPMEWIDAGVNGVSDFLGSLIPEGLIKSLIIDGIIGGVGGVIVFLPNILLLFLGIAFLEGTGYMARAAFVTDKLMHKVGLHGKSFIPMVLGFGCSVPAIMATRTLENDRDRLVTMLVIPLMSCGARLPVYTLLAAAFFSKEMAGNVLFSIYLVGILLAVIMAKVLRTWVLPGESEPFVMELPAYRLPTLRSILLQMWIRAWLYMKKAGTIILAASILIWGLFTFPLAEGQDLDPAAQMEQSYAGRMGQLVEPLIKPLGFDWRTGVALVAGFTAKEVVVSTMGTLYSMEDAEALDGEEEETVKSFAQRAREQSGYSPLTAYVLMLFILIYVPCLATIAIIRRETNSWKWPAFLIGYTLVLAWTVSFLVYRGGLLLGIGV